MRKLLLKSYLTVIFFWWSVAFFVFSISNPSTNLEVLEKLNKTFPFLELKLPEQASALDALHLQIMAFKYWTIPVLGLTAIIAGVGVGLAALYTKYRIRQRMLREKPNNQYWRDLGITLGELPIPPVLPSEETVLSSMTTPSTEADSVEEGPEIEASLKALPEIHRRLIDQIIGVLAAHPEAYVGPGHKTSLLEHSLNVLEVALSKKESEEEPLLPIAAIAHDLGKITAFEKQKDGSFKRIKWHDKESARILATLDGWWSLPELERKSLLLALRYDHSSGNIPFVGAGVREKALKLQNLLESSDRVATAEEKKIVLAELPLPDIIFEAFMKALPAFPLHVAGFAPAKNVKAAGWKKGDILFLLENQCRERVLATMDPDIGAALGGAYRAQHTIAPFSQALFQALESRALLIRDYNNQAVKIEEPMWNITSGTKEFKSVILIRITDEMRLKLPETDTTYDIVVTGPLRGSPPGEMAVASLDMSGLLRKPKKPRPTQDMPDISNEPKAESESSPAFKGGYKIKAVDSDMDKSGDIIDDSSPTGIKKIEDASKIESPVVAKPEVSLSDIKKDSSPEVPVTKKTQIVAEVKNTSFDPIPKKKRVLKKPPTKSIEK